MAEGSGREKGRPIKSGLPGLGQQGGGPGLQGRRCRRWGDRLPCGRARALLGSPGWPQGWLVEGAGEGSLSRVRATCSYGVPRFPVCGAEGRLGHPGCWGRAVSPETHPGRMREQSARCSQPRSGGPTPRSPEGVTPGEGDAERLFHPRLVPPALSLRGGEQRGERAGRRPQL